jgi:hypothetical protein
MFRETRPLGNMNVEQAYGKIIPRDVYKEKYVLCLISVLHMEFFFFNKFLLGYIHYTGRIHSDNSE